MAQGMERIPLAVDSDFKVDPVRAKFPDQQETDYKLVAFEPDQAATQPAPTSMGAGDTLSALGRNVWDAVVYHTPAAVASAIEGDEPYKTRDWKDALIERARERSKAVSQPGDAQTKTIIPGMTKQDINSLGPSLGFSVAGAGAGLGAGIPAGVAGSVVGTPAVGTVAGYTAGMAASGKAAYNMATNQFVRDLHDAANEEAIKATGKPVSPEAFAARQAELSRVIRDYGLWEAVPEAAGNALGFGILTAPVKGAIGKLFGKNIATRFASKMGALYGGELSTETVTQMGQHNVEVEAGMSKAPVRSFTSPTDWGESLREVAAPTILQTTLMAGGFKAGQMAKDRLAGKNGEEPPDNAIPAADLGAGPGGNGISGEFIPADQRQALPNMPGPGTTYDQDRTALPPGQTMLPLPMLPAPEDGGPSERQIATARGLLNHSPKASPELLQRLMRVDQATAAMLFNHWQGLKNGEVAGSEATKVPAQGDQGQGADLDGSGIVGGFSNNAVSFTPDIASTGAAQGGEPGVAMGATGAGPDAITPLDVQAHGAATSPYNATPQPTEAQKKAGNYEKGHVRFNGMDISIENPAGSVRSGTDEDGKAWENTLQHHYGYIKGTVGRDKDHLDVFIKPGAQSARTAYVIDQINPKTGRFDEHKIVLGASSEAEARAIYKANYADGWNGLGEITAMPIATFKGWIKSGKTKKPIAYVEPKEVRAAARKPATASNILQAIVNRGGISRDIMSYVGADTSARYMPGLFTNNGTTDLSTLAGDLFDEDGFHQIRQDSAIGPARELEDLIVRAINGEKIMSTAAMEKGAQAEETAKLKDKAQRLGVKTVARKLEDIAADVLRIEAQNVLDEETALEDEALVAYNETVDALHAAIGEDDAENFLEALASKYQDETHLNYLRSATADIQEKINEQALSAAAKPDEATSRAAEEGDGTGRAPGGDRVAGEEARPALSLSSQSEAELRADQERVAAAEAQRQAEGDRAAAAERQARIDAEVAGRQDVAADNFTLTPQVNNKTQQKKADQAEIDRQLAGQGDIFGQPKQREESDQDRSFREWTENYDRVSTTDDLRSISTNDLIRANGWASKRKQSEQRKGWDGGKVNQSLVDALSGEIDRIDAELRRRDSEKQPATPVAESLAPAQEAGDAGVAPGQGGAAADTIAGKPVADMSDDQLRNIARGLSPTFGEAAVDKAKTEINRRNAALRDAKEAPDNGLPQPARGEVGASLTKEQRKAVMQTLTDIYKTKGAPKESKGLDQNGNERIGYAYSPELFEKSDITGAPIRYVVTLPDGRIAHPTELFPDMTLSKVEALILEQEGKERDKAYQDKFRSEQLERRKSDTLNEANGKFNRANPGMGLEFVPALLTDGKQFIRVHPDTVANDLRLLGGDWVEKPLGVAADTRKVGDVVKLTKPGVNGRINIAGTVTKILPDGRLEVRTQQDGYMTVAESELGHKVESGKPVATYVPPKSVEEARRRWSSSEFNEPKPDRGPGHQVLMDAVRKALAAKLFYNKDVDNFVANELGVTADQRKIGSAEDPNAIKSMDRVEGGAFGYDVYLARQEVESENARQAELVAAERMKLSVGMNVGKLKLNDGKLASAATVESMTPTGVVLVAQRGPQKIRITTGYVALGYMADRAENSFFKNRAPSETDVASANEEDGGLFAQPAVTKEVVAGDAKTPDAIAGKPVAEMSDGMLDQIAKSSQPAAEKAKTEVAKRKKPKADPLAAVREFYTPGNIIHVDYWNQYDKVLEFKEGDLPGQWNVKVQQVKKDGDQWVPKDDRMEPPRWHATAPGKDKIVDRVAMPNEQGSDSFLAKPEELDADKIKAGYAHRSHSLSGKVEMERKWYVDAVQAFYDSLLPLARNDAQKAKLEQLTRAFRDEYRERRYRVLDIGSSTYSAAIAGPSNFNSKQSAQRFSSLDKAEKTFNDWATVQDDAAKPALLALRTDDEMAVDKDAAEVERVKKALKPVMGDLAMIGGIDTDQAPGMDRAAFVNGALRKIKNLSDAGDSATLRKVFAAISAWDEKHEKPLFSSRSPVWQYKPEAEEAPVIEKSEAAPDSMPRQYNTMDDLDSAIEGLYDGTLSPDDYKSAFRGFVANKEAIAADLNKLTKDQLYRRIGKKYGGSETKPEAISRALDTIQETFALRRSYGSNSYTMGPGMYEKYKADKLAALTQLVEESTAAALKEFSDEVAKTRSARQEKLEGAKDPKTIEDFDTALRLKKSEGMTFAEARMSLTPEQRAEYDRLKGMQSRDERKARADQQKTDIRVAATTAEGQIVETKHTKTGEPLFVVKAAERVARDVYNQWNMTAKRIGGWYSSYRGNGAVPGFQFKTRENADAFLAFIGGNAEQAQEAVQARRDAFVDDKSQSAVERLNEMADRLDGRADESLGQERKANTARRARFAAAAEATANADKAMAQTMRNLAAAIESGTVKFLDRVRQKVQIEMLDGLVHSAQWNYWEAKYPTWAEQEKHKGEKPVIEVADFAEFPQYTAFRSDLARLGRQMLEIDGTKKIGQRLLKVADDVTDAYLDFAKKNLHRVSTFKRSDGGMAAFKSREDAEAAIARSGYKGKAIVLPVKRGENAIIQSPTFARENGIWQGDDDKRITLTAEFGAEIVAKAKELSRTKLDMPYTFNYVAEKLARLGAMGIETPAEFRAALRELIGLKQAPKAPDRVKELERAMAGKRNTDGLDFFPTPGGTVQAMLDAAEIEEGMSVLEPSAGMGHIADLIRDAGVEPDVVELSGERRELLEAKGYTVVGSDFMDLTGRESFTFGDVFKAPDGKTGIMAGAGGMGSNRVSLRDANNEIIGYYDRGELEGIEKRKEGYDRIIMNPPFGDRRDAEHVRHAFDLLKPSGRLVAIMGEGVFFGQDKKAQAFRNWLEEVGGTSEKLDEGTFMDPSLPVNTAVNARMVVIDKPEGRGMESRSAASSTPELPDVIIGNPLGEAKGDDYGLAKAGSVAASMRLAQKLVTADLVEKLRDSSGENPLVVGVNSVEAAGKNALPRAGAEIIAHRLGLDTAPGIVQSTSPKRTGMDGLNRIFARPEFDGDVVAGRGYILVDDTLTQGGTFAALAKHIEAGGGHVVAIVALTGKQYSSKLSPSEETIGRVREKFGDIEDEFRNATGYGFDDLTESEARYLASFDAPDTIRDRILAENGHQPVQRNEGNAPEVTGAIDDKTPPSGGVSVSGDESRSTLISGDGPTTESARIVQSIVDKFKAQFKGTEVLTIRVVRTAQDIPARFRPSPFAEGVFHDDAGLIYLVTMNLKHSNGQVNAGRVWQVLMHEAVGHFGLAQMMGSRFAGILKQVRQAAKAKGKVTEDTYQPGDTDYATMEAVRLRYPEASDAEVAQEVLARIAETDPGRTLFGYVRAVVRQWLRDMARVAGFDLDVTTAELNDLVALASAYMRRGGNLNESAETATAGSAVASRKVGAGETAGGMESRRAPGAGQWRSPTEARTDDLLYKMQDKHIDLKRVQEGIKAAIGGIRDDIDAYLQEELFHGRAAKMTEEFLERELQPFTGEMKQRGITMEVLENFLWARHAKERNAQIAKINPDMPDGGSGLTDKQAADLMAGKDVTVGGQTIKGVDQAKLRSLNDLARKVDMMVAGNRILLETYELETPDTVAAWKGAYKHYVPLHREDADAPWAGPGTGMGYSVRGSSTKRATGSFRPVENILANLVLQRTRTITRGEKNRVSQALYGLAKEMPNPEFWNTDDAPKIRTVENKAIYHVMDGQTEIANFTNMADAERKARGNPAWYVYQDWGDRVVEKIDPTFRSKPNVVWARFGGEDRFVIFNERDPRAARMAESIKNLDADDIGNLLGEASRWTRYFASINTQYNPIFGVINLFRDAGTGLLNLKNTPLEGQQKALIGNLYHTLPAIYKAVRTDRAGGTPTGVWADLWEEFQEVGGKTGYRDMFRNSHEQREALEKALDPKWWQDKWWGKTLTLGGTLAVPEQFFAEKIGKPVFEWLSDYNTMMENGIRLSAYKVALDQGMSKERAASVAKNLTVNFNRKGQVARQAGALYAFFNASVQGTARMAETLHHGARPGELLGKAGKQIVYGGMLLGSMQALMLMAAGFDDDEPPEFVRDRNIVLPIPFGDKKYLTLPLPLGFHVLPAIGRISTEFVAGGFRNPGKHLVHILDILADSFNPIGNTGLSMQTIAPTVLDPAAALAENKDWTGKPIYREDLSKLSPTPGHARTKDTANALSKGLAYALNAVSGGTEFKQGLLSPTPDQIDYLIGQVTGGVGREVSKVMQTGSAMLSGEDLPPHKMPLVGRFYGDAKGQSAVSSRFYDNLKTMNEHQAEYMGLAKSGRSTQAGAYLKENPEAAMFREADRMQRYVSQLRKQKTDLVAKSAPREQVKVIEDRISKAMADFNQRVESIKNQPPKAQPRGMERVPAY